MSLRIGIARLGIRRWYCKATMVGVLCCLAPFALAQADYAKRIKLYETVQPVGDAPFGENVNMYTGELSFLQTDVELPGTGPTIVLARDYSSSPVDTFAGWSLSIPRIEVLVKAPSRFELGAPGENWQVATYPGGTGLAPSPQRCTHFNIPYDDLEDQWLWWRGGYEFTTDRGQKQPLLLRTPENSAKPSILKPDGTPYNFPLVTQQNWQIGCLPNTSNGEIGEGFLAVSPDGTRYFLDYLVGVRSTDVVETDPDSTRPIFHSRMAATMFVSRIEDRFGNYVSYNYQGTKLVGISASDGRSVAIQWRQDGVHRISAIIVQSATGATRTWQYGYDQYGLTAVVLPDGSRWTFTSSANAPRPPAITNTCGTRTSPSTVGPENTFVATAPSGLRGEFVLSATYHARSYVPSECRVVSTSYAEDNFPIFGTGSLIRKTFSGAGIPSHSWNYVYSPAVGSTTQDSCAQNNTCASTRWVDVTDPAGDRTRYTLTTRWGATEGKLVKVESFEGGNILKRTESTSYAPYNAGPYPAALGGAIDDYEANLTKNQTWSPVSSVTVIQDGITFSSAVGTFDTVARPVTITRSSSLGYTRSDKTQYYDNTANWVLGQVASVTCTAPAGDCGAGLVTSRTDYDVSSGLPLRRYRPGPAPAGGTLLQTMTYDTSSPITSGQRGMLKTVKDGNNNVTTFGDWKRGIPQSVSYADGYGQSAQVNDFGWIDWVTDENGFKTCYTYDALGRLTRIILPSETVAGTCNVSAWSETTFDFEYRTVDEHGISPGHWLRKTDTGTHRTNTYYDALLQPILVHDYDSANLAGTLRTTGFTYDHEGRVIFASYPTNTTARGTTGTWTEYDALGRVLSVSQDSELGPLTTLTAYETGLKTRVTNPKQKVTVTSYQAYDQPAYDWPVLISHPEGAFTHIRRDVFGKPTQLRRSDSASPAGGVVAVNRDYAYNSAQDLCRSVEPETGATLMGYDLAGNLAWSAAGLPANTICDTTGNSPAIVARKTTRSYDARNRIKTLSFPDGRGNTTNVYTADGLLASTVVNNDDTNVVTTSYTYNHRRLLTGERMTWGSVNWPIGYTYTTLGHLASQSYPNGQMVAFAPNALGQPTQVGPYAFGVQYYPNGAIKQFTFGNGIVHTMTQNARQLPARSSDSGGGNPLDLAYAYDGNTNVASITDYTAGAPQSRAMTYDGLDRLVQAIGTGFGTANYTYDVLDDIKTVDITAGSRKRNYAYVYDSQQRLTNVTKGVGGETVVGLSYDAQGNLANQNGRVFNFDYGNRLRGIDGVASYVYDGHGRRVRDYTSASKYSLYSQSGQLVYESDLRQAKATQYVYLAGSLVARVVNSTAPATPALTVPGFNTTGSYTVSWTISSGATSYELQEASSGVWTTVYNGTATSQVFTGKGAGNYAYRIRACLNAGCSNWSGTGEVAVQYAPAGIPILSVPATALGGSYTVGWSAVSSATTYVLEESVNGGAWTQVHNGAAREKSYTNKPLGSYGYRVKACNPAGCGGYSATATTQVILAPAGIPTLSTPAASTNGSYTVSWTTVTNATTYQLEESANGGGWILIHNAAGTSKAISGKVTGSYAYRGRACNTAGCGGYSATATTEVTLPPGTAPNLNAPATNIGGSYTVSWTAIGGATGYRLEEQVNGGGWALAYTGSVLSTALTGRAPATYGYRVRACNGSGCGPYSGTATTQVLTAPAMPASLTGNAQADSSVRPPVYDYYVFWSSVPAATYYELREETTSGLSVVYSGALTNYITMGRGTRTYSVRACNAAGCSAWKGTLTLP